MLKEVTEIISNLGYPIFISLVLGRTLLKSYKQLTEENKKLIEKIIEKDSTK